MDNVCKVEKWTYDLFQEIGHVQLGTLQKYIQRSRCQLWERYKAKIMVIWNVSIIDIRNVLV